MSDAVVGRTETPEALTRHAAQCGTTPARLRRTLRGDLDTIVAKALKKNARGALRRRSPPWPTIFGGFCVTSRSARGRTRCAIGPPGSSRRHVRGVATSAAVVLLLGGIDGVLYDPARDRARPRPAGGRESGQGERGADRAAHGRRSRLRTAPRGMDRRSAGLLDAGAEQVQRELVGQPEAQAEILTVMGTALSAVRRLRQGAASARTGARERTGGRSAPSTCAWRRRSTISAPC